MQEGYLYLWGKNYPKPSLIKPKVILAAAGENHIVFTTSARETFGMGSNKFGQLGIKQPQFYQQPVSIFSSYSILSLHCGAEHTFFITDKFEVYSTGLNIKGQLGHSLFDNANTPKIVPTLLPYGSKNKLSQSSQITKPVKSPIVQVLEKFDLQVKIQDPTQRVFLLQNDEYVKDIACGALFTLALTNRGRVFICGMLGTVGASTIDEQIQKTKFKQISFQYEIDKIQAGLSGAVAISKEGRAFIWGKFGKSTINVPKKIERQKKSLSGQSQDLFLDGKVGDQFAVLLNNRGEVLIFGQNIDNQLGCQSHLLPFKDQFGIIEGVPFSERIFAGRNYVLTVEAQNRQLYGWGSNKYGQIFPVESLKGLLQITNSHFVMQESDRIITSSYFTILITKKQTLNLTKDIQNQSQKQKQETIALSQYKKLLNDYQLLKALNMTLLQKFQPTRKETKQVQTPSKFQISGVTQYRKFNSNTEINWKEIQLQSQINQGGYGLIYKAKWRQIQVVVKKFKIQNGDVSLRDFLSECHAMEAVRHPHIVMFLGAVTSNPHYSIVLQYCSKGSLWSYLQNKDSNISWQDRRRFAIQIAQGVLYLHSCSPPILHRDLKSLNIFLDGNLRIKIGDFGWTKTLEQYMTNKIGTYQWMAPQVIGNKPYTEKADVFSYSIIMWEIASRQPPYRNINGAKVSQQVLNRQLRPTIPPKCPQAYSKLMKKCWQSDPSKRPGFKEIIRQLQVMKLTVN